MFTNAWIHTLPRAFNEEEDFNEPLKTSHIRHPKPHISADLHEQEHFKFQEVQFRRPRTKINIPFCSRFEFRRIYFFWWVILFKGWQYFNW